MGCRCAEVGRGGRGGAGRRYFEHHVKLLLAGPTVARTLALTSLVEPHGARLSRNARRVRADGVQERFVTQRCYRVGLATAGQRLEALVAAVSAAGFEIAAVEQEYVVFDSGPVRDLGWLDPPGSPEKTRPSDWVTERENTMRSAPARSRGFPPTYQPLPADAPVRQRAAFDPALKQYPNAYRAVSRTSSCPRPAGGGAPPGVPRSPACLRRSRRPPWAATWCCGVVR